MRKSIICLLAAVCAVAAAHAADVEGSADHPLISRYPGSEIKWNVVENDKPYKLPVGPITGYRQIDDWIETEGRVTRIYYELSGGERTHSEVYANYKRALEETDFELLAQGLFEDNSRSPEVGSRAWQEILFR
jgi:hypothetical protein